MVFLDLLVDKVGKRVIAFFHWNQHMVDLRLIRTLFEDHEGASRAKMVV